MPVVLNTARPSKYLESMATLMERPFSELINKPKDTLDAMARTRARSLRLRRRNAEDLMLTTASRYEQEHAVVRAATRVAVALSRAEPDRELLLRILPDVFSWVHFLPTEDKSQFLHDLVVTLHGVDDLDNLTPVVQLIIEWRHTAEVHADPGTLVALTQKCEDLSATSRAHHQPMSAEHRRPVT